MGNYQCSETIITVNYEMRRLETPQKTSQCTQYRVTGELLYGTNSDLNSI